MAWQIEMQCSNNCNQCATNQVTTSTSDCYTCSHCHSHSHSRSHCYSHDNDSDNKLAFNFQCNFNWNLILIDFPQHFLASVFQLSTLDCDLCHAYPPMKQFLLQVFALRLRLHFSSASRSLGSWPIFVFVEFISLFFTTPPPFPIPFLPPSAILCIFCRPFPLFFSILGALYGRENDWNVIKNCTANAAANAFSKRSRSAACRMPHAAYFVPREAASDGCKCFKAIWFSARNAGIKHTECAIVQGQQT